MSTTVSVYSKVLIKVPSNYINSMKNGTLLIRPPTNRKPYTKKIKKTVISDEIFLPQTETIEKPKLTKGSDAMREHMARMRSMRGKK